MRNTKSTNKELVDELIKLNYRGRFNSLIEKAKANCYHDYKNPDHIICGKTEFIKDAARYPDLAELSSAVINGEYDESPDEEDKRKMREDLNNPALEKILGLR